MTQAWYRTIPPVCFSKSLECHMMRYGQWLLVARLARSYFIIITGVTVTEQCMSECLMNHTTYVATCLVDAG